MSFWRKLNKAVFNISLVIFSLAVVYASIAFFAEKEDEWWIGLLILVGGAILIPIIFSSWGILLEFLDNVAAIRKQVCNGQPVVMNAAPTQTNNSSASVPQGSYAVATGTVSHTSDKWICDGCGKKNDGDAGFCFNCGKPKV